ncbi:hypothetical protein [Anaerospora sp.]|uniref:hypothetical protein n=1 Tax=Anaerospora sp. TaxID=1960278 RepID=UPI0028A1A606|nr:hypothetical protein [Anaerospora sp.]
MYHPLPMDQEIAALVPCYTATGDSTQLFTTSGLTLTLPVRPRAVLNRITRRRATDLAALRHITSLKTQRSILQPLPLAPHLLLIPVKVRTPRVTGDTCTGYINYYTVVGAKPCQDPPVHTVLTLTGGHTIGTLWTPVTINRYLQLALLTAYTHTPQYNRLQEADTRYAPELLGIAQRLAEVFRDILVLKNH